MARYKGELLILISSLIWGSAYAFQKAGMDYVEPFTFGAFRFCIGALTMLPLILWFDKRRKRKDSAYQRPKLSDRTLLMGSLLCGLSQFGAGSLQQIGLVYTTAGKAGFITSMHIVIVPILMIFLRRKVGFATWMGVALAVFGMYLLCITEGFNLQLGDGLVLACAAVYAIQIMLIDYYAVRTEPTRLAALQYLVAGMLSAVCMLGFEQLIWTQIIACAIPILYTGILEVGVAYTLEIYGQQTTSPPITAIILSLESIFAVVFGALLLNEQLTLRETIGCFVMMAAFLTPQISGLLQERRE